MNKREKNVMTEIKVMLAETRNDIKWIREQTKEHNQKLNKIDKNVTIVEQGFQNHLKQHEQSIRRLTILVSIIALLSSIILKVIF